MCPVIDQEQAANYGEPKEPVYEIVLLLWYLHLPIYDAFSGAATPEPVLVLLAHGGNGWRLGRWNYSESRRGHGICSVESRVSKGSDNYWHRDCRAGDVLRGIIAVT